jgi:hypothetical protein
MRNRINIWGVEIGLSTISNDYLELSTVVKLHEKPYQYLGCRDRPGHCVSKICPCRSPDALDTEEFTPLLISDN